MCSVTCVQVMSSRVNAFARSLTHSLTPARSLFHPLLRSQLDLDEDDDSCILKASTDEDGAVEEGAHVWWDRLTDLNKALLESMHMSSHTHTVGEMTASLARCEFAEPVDPLATRSAAPRDAAPHLVAARLGQLLGASASV